MGESDWTEPKRARESFNTVSTLYDRYRRGYPADVIAEIITLARLLPGNSVLEIGCGTGQLTKPLLDHGAHVFAVELGKALAAIAIKKLSAFPNVRVEVVSFENWTMPSSSFDAVFCATSFHWLDPTVRAAKCAQALRPGGALVAVYPHYVEGENAAFVHDTQPYYLKWGLSYDPDWRPPSCNEIPTMYRDIDECAQFAAVERHYIPLTLEFTRDEYVGLLRTDSLILTLTEQSREGFLADIAALIDSHYAGVIARDFMYEIVVGRKGERYA